MGSQTPSDAEVSVTQVQSGHQSAMSSAKIARAAHHSMMDFMLSP